jgi:hypothetical protein
LAGKEHMQQVAFEIRDPDEVDLLINVINVETSSCKVPFILVGF